MNTTDHTALLSLLNAIPADCSYDEWFRIASALKHEGGTLQDFTDWSMTCPAKYDYLACERTWEAAGNPENPITMGTLKMIAAKYAVKTIPVEYLQCPETEEAMIQQAVNFIQSLFQVGEAF